MRIILCMSVIMVVACGSEGPELPPDEVYLSQSLGMAVPVGYAATLAMTAKLEQGPTCVSMTSDCGPTEACSATATIQVGPDCPLPVGSDGSGTITIAGTWESPTEATLELSFANVTVDGRHLAILSASGFSAEVQEHNPTVVEVDFHERQVNLRVPRATVDYSTWDVLVETSNTFDDPTDDVLSISGARHYLPTGVDPYLHKGVSNSTDMSVTRAVMDPSCRLNPISGTARFEPQYLPPESNLKAVAFHEACDGIADIDLDASRLPYDQTHITTMELDLLE